MSTTHPRALTVSPVEVTAGRSLHKTARIAGMLYLLLFISGIYSIGFVRPGIIAEGNAAATVTNILDREFLFRTSVVNSLINSVVIIVFGIYLYQLFKEIDEITAKIMLGLLFIQVPMGFVFEALQLASIGISKGEVLNSLEQEERQGLVGLLLELVKDGSMALVFFWGTWLLPFGILIYKSKFIPGILGIMVAITGLAHITNSLIFLLYPGVHPVTKTYLYPFFLGELFIMLWLIIRGIKRKQTALL